MRIHHPRAHSSNTHYVESALTLSECMGRAMFAQNHHKLLARALGAPLARTANEATYIHVLSLTCSPGRARAQPHPLLSRRTTAVRSYLRTSSAGHPWPWPRGRGDRSARATERDHRCGHPRSSPHSGRPMESPFAHWEGAAACSAAIELCHPSSRSRRRGISQSHAHQDTVASVAQSRWCYTERRASAVRETGRGEGAHTKEMDPGPGNAQLRVPRIDGHHLLSNLGYLEVQLLQVVIFDFKVPFAVRREHQTRQEGACRCFSGQVTRKAEHQVIRSSPLGSKACRTDSRQGGGQ
jgi:hypothetical protein